MNFVMKTPVGGVQLKVENTPTTQCNNCVRKYLSEYQQSLVFYKQLIEIFDKCLKTGVYSKKKAEVKDEKQAAVLADA